MDGILKKFCKLNDFEECIDYLKLRLKFSEQCNEYDIIYRNYFDSINGVYKLSDVIPGLSRMVKFFIISFYYKHLLIKNTKICNDEQLFIDLYNSIEDNFSVLSMYQFLVDTLNGFFDRYDGPLIVNTECNRNCGYYFIFGDKSTNFSYDRIVDGLFNSYPIFYIGCRYVHSDLKAPHNGEFNSPPVFLWHDMVHAVARCINSVNSDNYEDWKNLVSIDMIKNSFRHRCIYAFCWYWLFDQGSGSEIDYGPIKLLQGVKLSSYTFSEKDEELEILEAAYERDDPIYHLIPDEAYAYILDISDRISIIRYFHTSSDIPDKLSDKISEILCDKNPRYDLILCMVSDEFANLYL